MKAYVAAVFVAIVVAVALLAGFMSNTVEGYSPNLANRIDRLEDRMLSICENSDEYATNERIKFLCRR